MSLITSPPIGYPDDQQQPQWQSPLLINDTNTLIVNNSKTYTTMRVANWQSVQVSITASTNGGNVDLAWFADSGLTQKIGECVVFFNSTAGAHFIKPNVGPYLRVIVTANAGTPSTSYVLYVNATNRSAPPWSTLLGEDLIDIDNVTLLSGHQQISTTFDVYGGLATFSAFTASAQFQYDIEYQDLTLLTHTLVSWNTVVGSPPNPVVQNLILPSRPLTVIVTNHSAGSAAFWAKLTADIYH